MYDSLICSMVTDYVSKTYISWRTENMYFYKKFSVKITPKPLNQTSPNLQQKCTCTICTNLYESYPRKVIVHPSLLSPLLLSPPLRPLRSVPFPSASPSSSCWWLLRTGNDDWGIQTLWWSPCLVIVSCPESKDRSLTHSKSWVGTCAYLSICGLITLEKQSKWQPIITKLTHLMGYLISFMKVVVCLLWHWMS